MKSVGGRSAQAAAVGVLAAWALMGTLFVAGTGAIAAERPVIAERNPPGDIPDSQAFITYQSPLGFSLQIPEGWARTHRTDGVRFADKYNAIELAVGAASGAPTAASLVIHEAADLVKTGRAIKIEAINNVKLPAGAAALIVYTSDSEPNPVTNRQLHLENNRYLIYRGGKLASINLSAPRGADNVDQWKRVANSFRWR